MTGGYPTVLEAERLLQEAECCNPGPWGNHSRVAAYCAKRIATAAGLDEEKAYVLGLLHDIGRKFGIKHLAHVYDGYQYMLSLGYADVARICLTHSFCCPKLDVYIGNFDIPQEQQNELQMWLDDLEFDDYDRLIQLSDCLAGSEGVLDIQTRMLDVKKRYGFYRQDKWDTNLWLKAYFEEKTGKNIYEIVKKEAVD